jgi:hypothetical protein
MYMFVQNTDQHKNFERWGKLVTAGNSQLLDLYPLLRSIPAALIPERREAEDLYKKECELYMLNWMSTKAKILDGTCHVSFSFLIQSTQLIYAIALLRLRCSESPKIRRIFR